MDDNCCNNYLLDTIYQSLYQSIFKMIAGQLRSHKTMNHIKRCKNFGFLSCFGGMECDKPYFNNSNSNVENSNGDKFITTSLQAKGITLLKVKFFSFFSCVVKIFFLFFTNIIINRMPNYVPINARY